MAVARPRGRKAEESGGLLVSPSLGQTQAMRSSLVGEKWGRKKVTGLNRGSRRGGGARRCVSMGRSCGVPLLCPERHGSGADGTSTWHRHREEVNRWAGPVRTISFSIYSNGFEFELVKSGLPLLKKFEIKYGIVGN
jgi:hypothetical protein